MAVDGIRRALAGLLLITAVYLVALVWIDSRNHVFGNLPTLIALMPVVAGLAFVSYLVRYLRWYWLLRRAGHRTGWLRGMLAYLAGFAFTATPGKVGELVRIRYLQRQDVPASTVLAAFIFERALDLVVVLGIAATAMPSRDLFVAVCLFVLVAVMAVISLARSQAMNRLAAATERRLPRLARLVTMLRDGLSGCRVWFNGTDLSMALATGLVAWVITSFAFVWLIGQIGISVPFRQGFAIYPLAMLAGAASMLPGGIGSTEATIVLLLAASGVAPEQAALAAIGIRLASLWFAVLCGFVSIAVLEYRDGPESTVTDRA